MDNRLPPLWKIKRELKRFPISVMSKVRASLSPLHRIRHDLTAHRTVRVIEGDRPVAPEVAIFLIYQPVDLLESLFLTLNHLNEKGMAVILVANHPIDAEKEALLRPHCFRMIERPNIGYDFGGYREGVLYGLRENLRMERLFLLNDSIWFPTILETDLIETARERNADLFGVYESSDWGRTGRKYLHSYFLRFGRTLIASKAFADYWTRMPFFTSKALVIEYCEMSLTEAFRKQGFTVDTYFKASDLRAATNALSKEQLMHIARLFKETEPRLKPDFGILLDAENDPNWENRKEKLLSSDRFSELFVMSHPLVTIGNMRSPFVKKMSSPHFRMLRREIFLQGMDTLLEPTIRDEIARWDQS